VVAEAIIGGLQFTLANWTDRAAVERMRKVLEDPAEVLADVQNYAATAFKRLYRQRNLVLHGGKTSAVALRACLRTATPLVGAGMDRLAHSYYVNKTSPLATAARARIALTTAGHRDALSCVDMLP
jgi:hypothetical protein